MCLLGSAVLVNWGGIVEAKEIEYNQWHSKAHMPERMSLPGFLRGFRSIYLGIIFNVLAMAGVTLAAIKIGAIMLDLSAIEPVLYAGGVTLIFSTAGGFRGVG